MKRALIVGINYEGTGHALRGCINDANNMRSLLTGYGFTVEMCLEQAATTAGIKAALGRLVAGAQAGDVLVFHYSGHGSQLPSSIESDKWEEIICPIDLNWADKVITDNYLKSVFHPLPNGVNVTIVLDCCHSGDGLDQTESYSPLMKAAVLAEAGVVLGPEEKEDKQVKSRFLPPPEAVQAVIDDNDLEIYQYSTSRDVNVGAMLIACCAPYQTSADAYIDGSFQGAGTYSLLKHLKANPTSNYYDLITKMNEYMIANRFTQRPQLDGSFRLHTEKVFQPWTVIPPATETSTPTNGDVVVTLPTKPPKKKRGLSKLDPKILVAGAVIIALILFFLTK